MKRAFVNIVVAMVVFVAIISAVSAGDHTGNYWGVVVVFCAAGLYLFIEWPSGRGTSLSAVQYGVTRALSGLAFLVLGAFVIWQGFSEFTKPVTFTRFFPNFVAQVIRDTVGPVGVSILLWWLGCAIAVAGVHLLRFAPQSPQKTNSVQHPNNSASVGRNN